MTKFNIQNRLQLAEQLLDLLLEGKVFTEQEVTELFQCGGSRLVNLIRYKPFWVPVPNASQSRIYEIRLIERLNYFNPEKRCLQKQQQMEQYALKEALMPIRKLSKISRRDESAKLRVANMMKQNQEGKELLDFWNSCVSNDDRFE